MALIRMCDTALDTSPDALLARIADLEDRIALAGTAAITAAVPRTEPVPPKEPVPPSADIGDDDAPPPWDIPGDIPPEPISAAPMPPPTDAPAPEPQPPKKRTAPKKAAAAAKPAASEPPTEKKVLHSLRGWQDAVKRVERSNPIIGSFLREYKVYTCDQDGKLYLRAANAFSVKLVTTNDDNVTQICAAVNAVLGEPKYTPADMIFDSAEKRITDGYEKIDVLIESAGDAAETAE